MKLDPDDYTLIGVAMIAAQKVEFALSGIAAHLTHLPAVASDARFRKLTPSNFLSSSPEKRALRKATLGQVARKFGKNLLLPEAELEKYVTRRNMIAHEFWREVVSAKGSGAIPDPRAFLIAFISDSDQWLSGIRGLLSVFIEAAEKKEGRKLDPKVTENLMKHRDTYYRFVEKHLAKNA
jgi:hypothetical protein